MVVLRFLIIASIFYSCGLSSGVKKDTQNRILSHKEFIRSLEFSGRASEKIYCQECKYNMYQVVIDIDEINPEISRLSDRSFPPYYFFESDRRLNISLTKSAFDSVKENIVINKKADSDSLLINGMAFRLLNKGKYEWLP
jgi:hypothetical protein